MLAPDNGTGWNQCRVSTCTGPVIRQYVITLASSDKSRNNLQSVSDLFTIYVNGFTSLTGKLYIISLWQLNYTIFQRKCNMCLNSNPHHIVQCMYINYIYASVSLYKLSSRRLWD